MTAFLTILGQIRYNSSQHNTVWKSMNLIKLFWYLIHVEQWPDKGHDWKRSECSFLLFSGNQAVVLDFLTLQDKDNKVTLSVNINALVNQARKPQFWLVFLPISKACTNNFYIFWQRVHIVCKSLSWYLHWYYLTYILTTSLQSNCQNHILLEFFSIFTQPWPLTDIEPSFWTSSNTFFKPYRLSP
jgi:hypothetical protein